MGFQEVWTPDFKFLIPTPAWRTIHGSLCDLPLLITSIPWMFFARARFDRTAVYVAVPTLIGWCAFRVMAYNNTQWDNATGSGTVLLLMQWGLFTWWLLRTPPVGRGKILVLGGVFETRAFTTSG